MCRNAFESWRHCPQHRWWQTYTLFLGYVRHHSSVALVADTDTACCVPVGRAAEPIVVIHLSWRSKIPSADTTPDCLCCFWHSRSSLFHSFAYCELGFPSVSVFSRPLSVCRPLVYRVNYTRRPSVFRFRVIHTISCIKSVQKWEYLLRPSWRSAC